MSTNYTPGIPNPPNNPSADVPIMQSNATSINNIWMPDHISFNNTAAGLHKQVTFALNQSAPGFVNGVSDLFVNSTAGVSGTGSNLFFQNALTIAQLTNLPITTTTPSATGFGVTTPWGLIINWGQLVGASASGSPLTFQIPYSTNSTYAINATGITPNARATSVSNLTTTGCTVWPENNGTTVGFFVFGY